ncbi:thiopurine S-methyltransferase [Shewanella gaetbuli]|uniref:Thiopurine S-methyltransferase n=1 Tax=Shewanella gaetbuli TaxID=220752 RepID=A0A9X2CK22_9GAMM|nr:thiopurine S-methyltransferase [Shewanella gaetbuli]MCL1141200.1 thiopurine S-methyltransferase [Shewanella gaetbuli]
MDPKFWHDKWQMQQIGFHQPEINPYLQQFWSELALKPVGDIFVPLCGKSLDMCYLAELGHKVIGCELSQTAVEQFFTDNQLSYQASLLGEHQVFSANQIQLIQGDIFSLPVDVCNSIVGFYDRAALIAFPDDMRKNYAQKLAELIPVGVSGLLVTLDYDQDALNGPPFAVSPDWVEAYIAPHFEVSQLFCEDVLADNPRFVNKQVPWLNEAVYKLTRKAI